MTIYEPKKATIDFTNAERSSLINALEVLKRLRDEIQAAELEEFEYTDETSENTMAELFEVLDEIPTGM